MARSIFDERRSGLRQIFANGMPADGIKHTAAQARNLIPSDWQLSGILHRPFSGVEDLGESRPGSEPTLFMLGHM